MGLRFATTGSLPPRPFVAGRWTLLALALAGSLLAAPASAQQAASPADSTPAYARAAEEARLVRIFDEDEAREAGLDPLEALYRGERIDPAALAQLYTDRLDRRELASGQQGLAALATIDAARLSPESRISYDVFRIAKQREVAWLRPDVRALTRVRPFNHFGGLHVEFPTLMARDGVIAYRTEADYRYALQLQQAFAGVLDTAVLRLRQGMAADVVESKLTVRNMIAQIDALLAEPIERSPFYAATLDFPPSVPESARPALRAAYATTIGETVYPAYRRLRAFLADEYLPAARDSVGLSAMKGGAALYRLMIERETTLRLDPDAVHRLGLDEVARIQREMAGVQAELGHAGRLRDFFDQMRTDPRFHPKSREELSDGFAAIARAVDAQIPRFFLRVPKSPLIIQPYPAYSERFEAGGSYNQGSVDGTRPGIFYYNTYDLPSRFLTGMTTLYLHEGAPGHHFQISLAQENTELPAFQRFDGNNAFVEGWALYAETLGYEMGFYKDPMQHWGTLDDEMLRAMRLVVDTGLHAKGWSRDQAIDYMLANSGMGRTDAEAEVDRYVAIPAQALSYKIGSLTIQRLRREAETALGAKFDIRAFHEQVLGSGALPLPVLEAKIGRWIAGQR
ncbi:MAG: DUF885 domain-containing protein [Novosphingobium sp.]|nr:DUF885 domain-containing protein [Novosphingobium sp.]